MQPALKLLNFAISSHLLPAGPEHCIVMLFLFTERKNEKLINVATEYNLVKGRIEFQEAKSTYE